MYILWTCICNSAKIYPTKFSNLYLWFISKFSVYVSIWVWQIFLLLSLECLLSIQKQKMCLLQVCVKPVCITMTIIANTSLCCNIIPWSHNLILFVSHSNLHVFCAWKQMLLDSMIYSQTIWCFSWLPKTVSTSMYLFHLLPIYLYISSNCFARPL